METEFYKKIMRRCLQLANNGLGNTYPNPLVGSVITYDNKIIGEGWHYASGKNHAEINAINSVKDKSLLKNSILFVNLEPCSHFGKTPPCSHKIVEMAIPKVVIGTRDYASHVNGKGIEFLRSNNISVIEGVLEKESNEINKRFFSYHLKKKPYIILKWAETKNGFFSPKDKKQQWITGKESKQLVHLWRSQEQAILVGGSTVRADNPQLNSRLWKGKSPIKIIVSNNLKNIDNYYISRGEKTLILNSDTSIAKNNIELIKLNNDVPLVKNICDILCKNNIQSVIVEGGRDILGKFIQSGMWDEARILKGNAIWKSGITAPKLNNAKMIDRIILGNDIYEHYYNNSEYTDFITLK